MRRITSPAEIQRIRSRGRPFGGRYVTLVAVRGEPGACVISGRVVGGAVSRNRARRRIKSYLRERGDIAGTDVAVLLICKKEADKVDYQLLVSELEGLFTRIIDWCDAP